ncbi:MAG: rRNA synthase [Verrucomicrobiota bacterium]|jgi:23S rRNA pseudouridine1911/1915/1917 synthase
MFRSEIKGALSATGTARANETHDFAIVAEADDFIVVEKPPFLLVHPTKPTGVRTLWSELKHLLAFEIANGGQVSIVNRLDRETSGLVLVAKNAAAARRFGLLMQEQRIAKEYLALVYGWPEWDFTTVNRPLARQGIHAPSSIWLKQAIHPAGAPALTEFAVERRFCRGAASDRFSIIRAIPRTGRTHQIRVHLASLGHSIVGDKIYGPDEKLYLRFIDTGWTPELEQRLLLPRQALHSAKLKIENGDGWTSRLPADLRNFVGDADSGRAPLPSLAS